MIRVNDICAWWRQWVRERRIPGYREACNAERKAQKSGCTQALGRAREAKSRALHADMVRPLPDLADRITRLAGKWTVV